jgi:hypothetical protein
LGISMVQDEVQYAIGNHAFENLDEFSKDRCG